MDRVSPNAAWCLALRCPRCNCERTLQMCETNRSRPISARPKGTNLVNASVSALVAAAQFTEANNFARVVGFGGLCEFLLCDGLEFLCRLKDVNLVTSRNASFRTSFSARTEEGSMRSSQVAAILR